MAARDGDKMRRSRHRKPIARRLGAQLGRTTADDTGYERTRRVGRRCDGRKQPISQSKQRPRRALIDRHQPDDLHFSKLASKHTRAPIRIVLKARNSTDSTNMRTGAEFTITRQPYLTQALFARIRIAGIGVRTVIDGRVTAHNKFKTARSAIIQRPRSTQRPNRPTRGHDRPRHDAKGRGIQPSSPPHKAHTGPSQYDASRSSNGNGPERCDGRRPLSQQQIGCHVKHQATARTQAGTKGHRPRHQWPRWHHMLALGRAHTQIQSLILASFFSPIPDTRIRSSTEAKAPFFVRSSIID